MAASTMICRVLIEEAYLHQTWHDRIDHVDRKIEEMQRQIVQAQHRAAQAYRLASGEPYGS